MSVKRTLAWGLIIVLVLILAVPVLLYFSVPAYLNSPAFTGRMREAGLSDFSWNIRRLSFFETDIGSLRIGPESAPALSVASVQVAYGPTGLLRREIETIHLSGVELYCGIEDGNFFFRSIDLNALLEQFQSDSPEPDPDQEPSLPVTFDRLILDNALIFFTWKDRTIPVPVEAEITTGESREDLKGVFRLYPVGEKLSVDVELSPADGKLALQIEGNALRLSRFAELTAAFPDLTLSGELDLTSRASLSLAPFQILSARSEAVFRNRHTAFSSTMLAPFPETADDTMAREPLRLTIETDNGTDWQAALTSLALVSPVPVTISRLTGTVHPTEAGWKADGNFQAALQSFPERPSDAFLVTAPVETAGTFSGTWSRTGGWKAELSAGKITPHVNRNRPWNVQFSKTLAISGGGPVLTLSGKGEDAAATLDYHLRVPNLRIAASGTWIMVPTVVLEGSLRSGKNLSATLRLSGPGTRITAGGTILQIPGIFFNGTWSGDDGVTGELELVNGSIRVAKAAITDIDASLPLRWPWQEMKKQGNLSAGTVRWDQYSLGGWQGFLRQSETGLAFGGDLRGGFISGFGLQMDGESAFFGPEPRTAVQFRSRYETDAPLNLGTVIPAAAGFTASGTVDLSGAFVSDGRGTRMSAETDIHITTLTAAEQKVQIENIRLNLSMPRLMELRSAPGQILTAERITAGRIVLNNIRIQFQIESGESVLVENSRLNWCDGTVNAQAIRIVPGVAEYDLILYCDRLRLAELLEQLGAAEAEGEGTVNGKIPVRFAKGDFSFDDGFLYSTPGENGTIHVTGTEMLTAGMPEGSPQSGQIELAQAALKDYVYDWVRLRINTVEDVMVLQLQFDGKPTRPLPFVYREEAGGFVRVDGEGQLSNFQGIRLNVNLEMPLNKILEYKGILEMIQ